MIRKSLYILLLLFYSYLGYSQGSAYNFKFKNYLTQHGLVHNHVMKVEEDSRGFLWIATQYGLSRFDGSSFKNFLYNSQDKKSLPSNTMYSLAIDKHDKVWLALNSDIAYYDQAADKFDIIKYKGESIRAKMMVYDKVKNNMIVANHKGYYVINASTHEIKYFTYPNVQIDDPTYLGHMLVDSKRQLWIPFTRKGFLRINLDTHTPTLYAESIWPLGFHEDNDGIIWVSTWIRGTGRIVEQAPNWKIQFYDDPFMYANFDKNEYITFYSTHNVQLVGDSIIIVGVSGDGLRLLDKKQGRIIKKYSAKNLSLDGLYNDYINYLYTTKNGVTWICTWNGLSMLNKDEQQFNTQMYPYLDGKLYNLVSGIADDPQQKNIQWMAVNGSGLVKLNKENQQVIQKYFYYKNDANNFYGPDYNYGWRWPWQMQADNKGSLWVSGYDGLIKIQNGVPKTIFITDNKTFPILAYEFVIVGDDIWIATKGGLCSYNTKNGTYHFYLPNFKNHASTPGLIGIKKISDNTLAVTGRYGTAIFHIHTKSFEQLHWHFKDVDSVAQQTGRAIEVHNQSLFIGTHAGLIKYDIPTNTTALIGNHEGIDKLESNSLKMDAYGNLWAITNHKLYRYTTTTGKIQQFSQNDGIYNFSDDLNSFFEYGGRYYIGYRCVTTAFNPALILTNHDIPKSYITDVIVNGTRHPFTINTQRFKHTDNEIAFNFSAPFFTNADKVTFYVKLDGYNNTWVPNGQRKFVSYNNLLPGNYTFYVKAAINDRMDDKLVASYSFVIKPALWQQPWFIPLLAILFAIGVIGYAYYRVQKIRKLEEQKTKEAQLVAELEMKALRSQMNPHFIFNSLNSVQKYIWENRREDASDYIANFSKLIRMILNALMHKTVSVTEEINMIKAYLTLEHRRCNNKFNYQIEVDPALQTDMIKIPPMLVQPYIENAIWHGFINKPEIGNLHIRFTLAGEELKVIIDDDGIGRSKAMEIKKSKATSMPSVGMSITEQRINLFQKTGRSARVEIIDKMTNGVPSGTTVYLNIPI